MSALFESVPLTDYAVNRAIDAKLKAFGWDDMEALCRSAGLLRPTRYVALARRLLRQAQADWPRLLKDAPPTVRASVLERLNGGVALTA